MRQALPPPLILILLLTTGCGWQPSFSTIHPRSTQEGSSASDERRADGALVLGILPVELDGFVGEATFLEKHGQPSVEIRFRNATDRTLYWVADWPGCHWSGTEQAVWADERPVSGIYISSVGCSWFEAPRPPTHEEIKSYSVSAGTQVELWRAGFLPDGWTEADGESTSDSQPRLRSWEFEDSIVRPLQEPPESLPDGWEKSKVEFQWSAMQGPALRFTGYTFR